MRPPAVEVAPPRAATEPPLRTRRPTQTARAVIAGFARTLLVPLIGLVWLVAGWMLTAASGWPAAAVAVTAWAAGNAVWLSRRGWSPALVHRVTWLAPVVVLVPAALARWLTDDELVVWSPVITLLAVALTLAHEPLRYAVRQPRNP